MVEKTSFNGESNLKVKNKLQYKNMNVKIKVIMKKRGVLGIIY